MSFKNTERIGIGLLEVLFGSTEWLFREQPVHDYGIDAHIEIVDEGDYPTGQLIALQIKSGTSFFSEQNETSIVFRPEEKHVYYWLKHCLPVVIILCDPTDNTLYWYHFTKDTVIQTGKGYKIIIPKSNVLAIDNYEVLKTVHSEELYISKLNKLILDKELIERVSNGEILKIKIMDWINKSLPRTEILLTCDSDRDFEPLTIKTIYMPGASVLEIAENYFIWADLETDYDDQDVRDDFYPAYEDDCYMGYDSEEKEAMYTKSFEEWFADSSENNRGSSNGETVHYSYILSVNELGVSFINLYEYLFSETDYDLKHFQLED